MLGHAPTAADGMLRRCHWTADDPAYKGQRDFTPLALRFYDPFVLQFSAGWVWRCPLERLLENYRWHIRPNHLDVGPGTGYFLEHAGLPEGSEVTILDPNLNVLHRAAERLGALDVTAVEADVLKPLPVKGPFGSVGMNLVLHCLPGPMVRKSAAIRNVAKVLGPDGLFFGSTVLGDSGNHSWAARRMLDLYNGRGSFDNRLDTAEGVREILDASFEHVELDVVGFDRHLLRDGPQGTALGRQRRPSSSFGSSRTSPSSRPSRRGASTDRSLGLRCAVRRSSCPTGSTRMRRGRRRRSAASC